MEKESTSEKEEKVNKKQEFNIIVTYAEDGKSFQSIVENIILRKMGEI